MKNDKIDLRKLPKDELEKVKYKAMQMLAEGVLNKEVARELNTSPSTISRWSKNYINNSRKITSKIPGRKQGTQKKISDYQEVAIIEILQQRNGLLGIQSCIDTIQDEKGIKIPDSTMSDYLKKWGVNSRFIMEFENEFVENVGIDNFKLTKKEIMKRQGIIIWVTIMNYKIEPGINIYSISTRAAKNRLVFKFYREQIQPLDLIGFINQVATSFTKHLYVVFSTKNIQFRDNSYSFENTEKITFIHDS